MSNVHAEPQALGRGSNRLQAANPDVVITHPNRDSAAAKGTRLFTAFLLLASAALLAIITFGAWGSQAGALGLQIVIGLLMTYYAYLVLRWQSGILPVAAATAVIAGLFAAISVTGWFNRGGVGYDSPPFPEEVTGVLVFGFAVLQLVVVVVALKAFSQQWQVELEVPKDDFARQAGPPVTS